MHTKLYNIVTAKSNSFRDLIEDVINRDEKKITDLEDLLDGLECLWVFENGVWGFILRKCN